MEQRKAIFLISYFYHVFEFQWHHWLVGNIPGAEVGQGETLSEYVGSGPPEGKQIFKLSKLILQYNNAISNIKIKRQSTINFKVLVYIVTYF